MSTEKKCKAMCHGCRNDFYNGNNPLGVAECWSYRKARVVTRWRIGWWVPMDRPENFEKVRVLGCYHQTGTAAFLKELPQHIKAMAQTRKRGRKIAAATTAGEG